MSGPIRVLELRSVRGTGGGPEKTILLGAARSDPRRFAVTVCYLRDVRDTVFGIDDRARDLGIDYVEVREKHSFDPSIVAELRNLIRNRRIDIVHAHEYKTDLLAWLLGRVERVTPLATVHGWTGDSTRERLIYYPLDKRLLSRFPRVLAVSTEIASELVRCGAAPERVSTLLNGIDHRTFVRKAGCQSAARCRLGIRSDEIVIGAVGRLERQKRFDLLIDAVVALRARGLPITLMVVGDGRLRAELEQHIDQAGAAGYCRLLGQRDDIIDLHPAFDLFVQSSDYEGTPNAVLEAMALETPIVATDVGGTAELLRDGIDGVVVKPGSSEILAAAIKRALNEGPTLIARAAAARRRVETTLSFDARMDALENVYLELAEEQGTRRPAVQAQA